MSYEAMLILNKLVPGSTLWSLSTTQSQTDAAPVGVVSLQQLKAKKRKQGIWTGTSRLTSVWLMLLSELRTVAGMSTKGYVITQSTVPSFVCGISYLLGTTGLD